MNRKSLVPFLLVLLVLVSTACVSAQPAAATKQVIFRDDDVAPTRWMNVLEAVNQVHIDENVPVTLGIIPHPQGQASDGQLFPDDQPIPLGSSSPTTTGNELRQDPAFFDYMSSIASNPLFEFAQHGYTHKNNSLTPGVHNESEFAGEPFDVQYAAIQQGRDDIKDAFGITPTTFIPPWDRGDLITLEALRALGFTEYCTGSTDFAKLQGSESGIRVEAASVDIDGANYTALNESVQVAKNTTDQFFSDPNNSTLIIAYHWWTFTGPGGSVDASNLQLLRNYIDFVKTKEGVQFTRLDRQVTVSPEAAYGIASSLTDVSGAITPYLLWLAGSVGIAYLVGFAWFFVNGRSGRKD